MVSWSFAACDKPHSTVLHHIQLRQTLGRGVHLQQIYILMQGKGHSLNLATKENKNLAWTSVSLLCFQSHQSLIKIQWYLSCDANSIWLPCKGTELGRLANALQVRKQHQFSFCSNKNKFQIRQFYNTNSRLQTLKRSMGGTTAASSAQEWNCALGTLWPQLLT